MTSPFRLVIPGAVYDALLAHARDVRPAECCGLPSAGQTLTRRAVGPGVDGLTPLGPAWVPTAPFRPFRPEPELPNSGPRREGQWFGGPGPQPKTGPQFWARGQNSPGGNPETVAWGPVFTQFPPTPVQKRKPRVPLKPNRETGEPGIYQWKRVG